ncbi:hypothetical protein SEUCBS139899_000312 [Sporothrix eucalyptigena]|uniref:Uncharacterized protein n=1 Tax=Sporothrix eucalyptigena TaxID=1812306 RepID=A0ABP0CLT9_9PEZI
MGQRDYVVALLLRLDRDQECYNFVKLWAVCDPDGTYDWGDVSLPHLNLHGEDILEGPAFLLEKFGSSMNHRMAILPLDLKLLVDVRNIKVMSNVFAAHKMPAELQLMVEPTVVRSPIAASRFVGIADDALTCAESTLMQHARTIGSSIFEANNNFMVALFEPNEALPSRPPAYSVGSWEEANLAMQASYSASWEAAGVLDLLQDARPCPARESANGIFGLPKHQFKNNKLGRDRTPESSLLICAVTGSGPTSKMPLPMAYIGAVVEAAFGAEDGEGEGRG